MKFKIDWFLVGMAGATLLAWLFPTPGAAGGWLHPELLTKVGIALIFFLHGVALSFPAMKAGAFNWRLHLAVQTTTFLFFPLLGLAVIALLGGRIDADLRLGIFYLCALPSTVSSSVAFTAAAGGNVAGAVFNATLSSLLGIVLTPLWVGVVAAAGGHMLPLGPVVLDLVRWLLAPLAAGQLMRPLLGAIAQKHKSRINVADRWTILVLVYTSFCESFQSGVWSKHGWGTLLGVVALAGALFWVALLVTSATARALRLGREDRIAAIFCGSKKTLASGVPMAHLIFGPHLGVGVILLPIMIYHPLQLVICGVLAGRWRHAEN